jgi:hypothetical protein
MTVISRTWAMPSPATFSIPPVADLLRRWTQTCPIIVDPFAGDSMIGSHRNDLKHGGVDAEIYCRQLHGLGITADAVLFDPPYSPRQISEVYKSIGLHAGMKEAQNATLYKRVRDALDLLLRPGGIAISFGWNSAGFGKSRGYETLEIMLVAHGGAHNDTIVVVERK